MNFDNVLARTAYSNLTAAQVVQRRRDMMSSQIQSFDAAFGRHTQATSAGASAVSTSDPAWFNGSGAQFTGHSSGLSGEKRKAGHKKVRFDVSSCNGMAADDPHQK